jgi:CBS domain-containing protein
MLRPAIAGLVVGCLGLVIPGALGTGYGFVQAGLDSRSLLAIPLWMILVLPFAKILSTSLSIGSGGSGGVFGPGMVVGGLLGAGIWRLLEPFAPAIPTSPAPFVIVAMMALFGSVAHAPLAVMLMVAEMTGNLSMLAPAMIAVGLATFVVGNPSIYKNQLATRSDSPAHRFRFAMPLLASVPVGDAARQARVVVRVDEVAADACAKMEAAGVPGAPVVARDGSVMGMVDLDKLWLAPGGGRVGTSGYLRDPILAADDGLDDALGSLADHHRSWAPVVTSGRLVGILSVQDAMAAYRTALRGNIRQVRGLGAGGVIIETEIAPGSALAGRRVSEVAWPREAVLVAVERAGVLHVPRGELELMAGDLASIFAAPSARPAVEELLDATAARADVGASAPRPGAKGLQA